MGEGLPHRRKRMERPEVQKMIIPIVGKSNAKVTLQNTIEEVDVTDEILILIRTSDGVFKQRHTEIRFENLCAFKAFVSRTIQAHIDDKQ